MSDRLFDAYTEVIHATDADRIAEMVLKWHNWYVEPSGQPPVDTEEVIVAVQKLGYGIGVRDSSAIFIYMETSPDFKALRSANAS